MKLVYQYAYMTIFFIFKRHQIIFIHYKSRIATAIRNSRLVVDEAHNKHRSDKYAHNCVSVFISIYRVY